MENLSERLETIEEDLLSRAFLYDHPSTYRDGVAATLTAVRTLLARSRAGVA